MPRRFLTPTILLLACVEDPSRHQLEPEAIDHRVRTAPQGVVVSPPPPPPRVALPDAPCVPVTDCRIVARHRLESRFAREHGFYRSRAGLVASRYSDWLAYGCPEETRFIEVTESCSVPTGFYIVSGRRVWLPSPQSCGPNTCANSTGYYFGEVESAHARHFRPLGHGFFDGLPHNFARGRGMNPDYSSQIRSGGTMAREFRCRHRCSRGCDTDLGATHADDRLYAFTSPRLPPFAGG